MMRICLDILYIILSCPPFPPKRFYLRFNHQMQHTDDLTDLNPLINSDLSVRIVNPSISSSAIGYEDGANWVSKLCFCWVRLEEMYLDV